jgi:hypothetical protein
LVDSRSAHDTLGAMGYFSDIAAFHTKFQLPPMPSVDFQREVRGFRERFLLEEMIELQDAWLMRDMEKYLDALVDLNYVNLGTIYLVGANDPVLMRSELLNTTPHLPGHMEFATFVSVISGCLARMFADMARLEDRQHKVIEWGQLLHGYVEAHAHGLGFNFEEAWRRVQEANMQKVRTARVVDSARGSTFDVVKPEGWTPPVLADLCTPAVHG